jgi:hypothetical protein
MVLLTEDIHLLNRIWRGNSKCSSCRTRTLIYCDFSHIGWQIDQWAVASNLYTRRFANIFVLIEGIKQKFQCSYISWLGLGSMLVTVIF